MEKSFTVDTIQGELDDLQQIKPKLVQHVSELVASGIELEKKISDNESEYDALLKECNNLADSIDVIKTQVETTGTFQCFQKENDELHSKVKELKRQIENENTSFNQLVCKFKEEMQEIRNDMVTEKTNSTIAGAAGQAMKFFQRSESLKSSAESKQREIENICLRVQEMNLSKNFQLMSTEDFDRLVMTWEMIKVENKSAISCWNKLQQSESDNLMNIDK